MEELLDKAASGCTFSRAFDGENGDRFSDDIGRQAEARGKVDFTQQMLLPKLFLMVGVTSSGWDEQQAAQYSGIAKMDDAQLQYQIDAGEYLCRPHKIPPQRAFVEQLKLAKAEKERRAG
jgi:hypothetical protein